MGCRIFEGSEAPLAGPSLMAHFYCSTTMWAFGPIFETQQGWSAVELAHKFLEWLPADPRTYNDSQLENFYDAFLKQLEDKH